MHYALKHIQIRALTPSVNAVLLVISIFRLVIKLFHFFSSFSSRSFFPPCTFRSDLLTLFATLTLRSHTGARADSCVLGARLALPAESTALFFRRVQVSMKNVIATTAMHKSSVLFQRFDPPAENPDSFPQTIFPPSADGFSEGKDSRRDVSQTPR